MNILLSSTLTLNNFTKSKAKTNPDIVMKSRTMHLGNMGDTIKDGTQARIWDDLVLNTLGVVRKVATMEKIFTEI